MEDKIIQLGYDVLAVLIPVLVAMAVEYLRRKLGTEKVARIAEELEAKQELALLAVRFAEQVYYDLEGPEKYKKAAAWLANRAQEKGLKISDDEIEGLIEAALRELKDALGEEWAEVVKENG